MYFFLRVFLVSNLSKGRSRRMMDKQHLRTCWLHQLQPLDMPWWRNNYRRRLELHTLEVLQTPSVGEVSDVLEFMYVLASCSIKTMRGVAMVTTLSHHQQTIMVSTLNVLLLTLNKALPEGRPRITRFILMPISLQIKFNHASLLPLSILVCSSLDVCPELHS